MPNAQDEIIQAMSRPEFYPHPVDKLEHIQTHISHVFLAGPLVYKLKKPVNLGFLDFSTLGERILFCREEVRLNRRLAPSVYQGVSAVTRRGGRLGLAPLEQTPAGQVLEPCVRMSRMDAGRMMDSLLSRGRVGPGDAEALAGALAEFYASARRGPEVNQFGRPAAVAMNSEENFRQTENYRGVSVSSARWRFIRDYSQGFLEGNRSLFLRRVEQGRIVDGHGDLHSGNINLPAEGPPLIFDCIEFNQRFRFQDAACDLAFLAMDLEFQGREGLARTLVDTYASLSGDRDLPRVLNFYKCYRAVVRAKVHGFELDDPGLPGKQKFTDLGKARAYFRLAARYAGDEPPFFMVCFMGLMGTGKTYLARELCRRAGWPHLQSDRVRKQMAGLAPKHAAREAWGRGLYSPQRTDETYQALWEGARARLAQGGDVVVDASFNREDRRLRFLGLAREYGARALLIQVTAAPEVTAARLARRSQGASISDGRPELRERQARDWRGFSDRTERHVLRIDGGKPLEEKMKIIEGKLKELGRGR